MKLKILAIFDTIYKDVYFDSQFSYTHNHETKFHLVDKSGNHIHGYWLFNIGHGGLRRTNDVSSGGGIESNIDTDMTDSKMCLKIIGVDEL